MTLPYEEVRAIKNTRLFLVHLLDPKKTKRVPAAIRQFAYHLLRHYPMDLRIEEVYAHHEAKEDRR